MVQLPASFDPGAKGQQGVEDYTPIPANDYVAHIVESDMVKNGENAKDPEGWGLKITWLILTGEFKDRRVFSRLNLVNNSEQTVVIANKHLKSICDAVAVPGPVSDTNVLHGRACVISVIIKPSDSGYGPKNKVKNYSLYDPAKPVGTVAPAGAQPALSGPPQASSGPPVTGSLPWKANLPPAQPESPGPPASGGPPALTPAAGTGTSEAKTDDDGKPPWLKS